MATKGPLQLNSIIPWFSLLGSLWSEQLPDLLKTILKASFMLKSIFPRHTNFSHNLWSINHVPADAALRCIPTIYSTEAYFHSSLKSKNKTFWISSKRHHLAHLDRQHCLVIIETSVSTHMVLARPSFFTRNHYILNCLHPQVCKWCLLEDWGFSLIPP